MLHFLLTAFKAPFIISSTFTDLFVTSKNTATVYSELREAIPLPFGCQIYPSFGSFLANNVFIFIIIPAIFISVFFTNSTKNYFQLVSKIVLSWIFVIVISSSGGPSFLRLVSTQKLLFCDAALFVKIYLPIFIIVSISSLGIKYLYELFRHKNRNKAYDNIIEKHQKPVVTFIQEKPKDEK